MNKILPLIPSFNPNDTLINYVKELYKIGFNKIIIIDDGSIKKDIFNELKKFNYCIILTHQINLGKGAAIKTGFRYYIRNLSEEYDGIITIDDDNQHSIEDVCNLINFYDANSLILGVRNFKQKNVPLRSKLGNSFTSKMYKLFYKKKITDTQTGLRVYPKKLINDICFLDGNHFDFETNVLIYCIKKEFNITEITINTIYINNNKTSRYKTFKDSINICKIFIKGKKKR